MEGRLMSLLETVVRKRNLPDYRYYVEISTTGMTVTCRVIQDAGRTLITREIFQTNKSQHKWLEKVEWFYKVACEHYPVPVEITGSRNVNKSGSFGG
jgi:hypothetical protein